MDMNVSIEQRDAVADHLWDQMIGVAKSSVREAVEEAFRAAGIDVDEVLAAAEGVDELLSDRLNRIASEIRLGMDCNVRVGMTPGKGPFVQIRCWRRDTITGEMGYGFGGKAYPSEHATDSEIIQTIFGLYRSYWEHEARETFIWRDRRPFGPHISTEALWSVARKVDVRSARHIEDREERAEKRA